MISRVMRGRATRALVPMALALAVAATPASGLPPPKQAPAAGAAASVSALIREGTALHDAGRHDEAIARYLQALGLAPDDSTARYELAFSYHAKKDYARCLEATRVGLREPGDNEARLYSIAGNCLDDSGRSDEAVATYREGLGKHPDDARLRCNLAVAFWRRTRTPEWRLAAAPVFAPRAHGVAESFAFLVGERAGVAGTADWVARNGAAMRRLAAAQLPATTPPR